MSSDKNKELNIKLHLAFLRHHLNMMPQPYSSQESNKLSLVYFVLASLDCLGQLDVAIPEGEERLRVIDYIYSLQILTKASDDAPESGGGWRGSHAIGLPFSCASTPTSTTSHDLPHIAMSYVALCLLLMLGDDFSRVRRSLLLKHVASLQHPNGCFGCTPDDREGDMRFVYCAAAICFMLDDWSHVDADAMERYITGSVSYEGALGQGPLQESHGGSTFTGVAALALMGRLGRYPERERLLRWCAERQVGGFQGRANKPADTCYSFWIGATLEMLGRSDVIQAECSAAFTFSCQGPTGGFAKLPDVRPDVLHTYYGLAGLSIAGHVPGLQPIHTMLAITTRAHGNLAHAQETLRLSLIHISEPTRRS